MRWGSRDAARLLLARDVLARDGGADPAVSLYTQWYAAAPPAHPPHPWEPPASSLLRAAHGHSDRWDDHDYPVVARGIAGAIVIDTSHGRRALTRGEYVTTQGHPGCVPQPGDRVRPLERRGAMLMGGWWRTWGGGWQSRLPPSDLRRMYVQPRPGHVAEVVHQVTLFLARCKAPWCLKVVAAASALSRPDAIVTYFPQSLPEDYLSTAAQLVQPWVEGPGPALTARIVPGVAWADDPGNGLSFGEERCAAIVSAYQSLDAHPGGTVPSDQSWLRAVAHEFDHRGLNPSQPHLRATATSRIPELR